MTIKTNNVPRLILDSYELTAAECDEFDYMDWTTLETARFVRFKGQIYDLAQFMVSPLKPWDGYRSDSWFSGILVRYCEDADYVIMATFYD